MNDDLLKRSEIFNAFRSEPLPQGLQQGAFYWVRIVEGDERVNVIPETIWQPARYTGRAGDSIGETWDFLGYLSADGHHHVDVIQVGPEIVPVL